MFSGEIAACCWFFGGVCA